MQARRVMSRREFVDTASKAAAVMSCCLLCRKVAAGEAAKEAPKPEFKVVAPCGIYCGACQYLVKSMDAKDPKDIVCLGCLSDKVPEWSRKTCKVRPCAMEKKLESCALCKSCPCDKVKEVHKWAKAAPGNLKRIAEKGLEEFKKEQKAKWSCRKCGAPLANNDKKCRKCGEPVQADQDK